MYRNDIFKECNRRAKKVNFYNFEYIDELYANEYIEQRDKVAEGDERKLLDVLLYGKNEEQEYGVYAQQDENEQSVERMNFGSTMDAGLLFRFSHVSNTITEKFINSKIKILDIGCSKGTFYRFWKDHYQPIKKPSIEYLGLDIREKPIKFCKENFENIEKGIRFENLNIMTDTLPSDKYNVILLMEIIEHVPKSIAKDIIAKCKEYLSEDGILVISTPSPKKEIGQNITHPNGHVFEYSISELKDLMTEFELQIQDFAGWFGRGSFISLGLDKEELLLAKKLEKLGPGLKSAILTFLKPELAECITIICSHGTNHIDIPEMKLNLLNKAKGN